MRLLPLLRRWTRPLLLPAWWQDALLTLPRLACAWLLASDFGPAKFGLPWSPADANLRLFEVAFWFPQDVGHYGGPFAFLPGPFAWMGAFSEAVGGIFLLLGLQTRSFSLLVTLTMLVAVFCQQLPRGLWNALPALGFLWVALYGLVLGSGRFGLDYLLTRKHIA